MLQPSNVMGALFGTSGTPASTGVCAALTAPPAPKLPGITVSGKLLAARIFACSIILLHAGSCGPP